MAWRLAVLAASATGALVVLAAGPGEVCAGGAACPAAPSGEEDEVGLLQVGGGDLRSLAPPDTSLLAGAVSRALAAQRGNASAPSAEDIERIIRSRYALAVGDVINSAIEDSVLADEAKEFAMKELKDPSSRTSVALMGVVGKVGYSQSDVADAVSGALSGSDAGFIPDWISDQIQDFINSNAGGIMDNIKSSASGTAAQTIKDTFGVDICDLPFGIPGFDKSSYCSSSSSSGSSCKTQTGGTCSFSSCSSSRNAVCKSGKCVCSSGSCAQGGKCVSSCLSDTGGTCSFSSCSSSRNAVCQSGKCVCSSGSCAQGGKCVSSR